MPTSSIPQRTEPFYQQTRQTFQSPMQRASGMVSRYAGKVGGFIKGMAKSAVDNYTGKTALKEIDKAQNDPKSSANLRRASAERDMRARYSLPKSK